MYFALNIKFLPSHKFFKVFKIVKIFFNIFGRFSSVSFNIYLQVAICSIKKSVSDKNWVINLFEQKIEKIEVFSIFQLLQFERTNLKIFKFKICMVKFLGNWQFFLLTS